MRRENDNPAQSGAAAYAPRARVLTFPLDGGRTHFWNSLQVRVLFTLPPPPVFCLVMLEVIKNTTVLQITVSPEQQLLNLVGAVLKGCIEVDAPACFRIGPCYSEVTSPTQHPAAAWVM